MTTDRIMELLEAMLANGKTELTIERSGPLWEISFIRFGAQPPVVIYTGETLMTALMNAVGVK